MVKRKKKSILTEIKRLTIQKSNSSNIKKSSHLKETIEPFQDEKRGLISKDFTHPSKIFLDSQTIEEEIQQEYEQEKKDLIKGKTRNDLLTCLDWVYTTHNEISVYGKITTLLEELQLISRLDECLEKGFLHFNEYRDDEDQSLISQETIEYDPNPNKHLYCNSCWDDV